MVLTILCSLTAVNAADSLNVTAVEDDNILTIENEVLQSGTDELNTDYVQSISKEYGEDIKASSQTDNAIIQAASITKLIVDAKEGSTVVLDANYTLNNLLIRKNNITIDGNGYTLSGANLNRILSIESDYVKLINLNFVDGYNKSDFHNADEINSRVIKQ